MKKLVFLSLLLIPVLLFAAVTEADAAILFDGTDTPAAGETTPEATPVPEEDVKYVDLDHQHFYVNGTEFVLGKTTLQDMIDAGVPFDKVDLEDANNNLRKNSRSLSFGIPFSRYWSAYLYVMNDTNAGKRVNECYISEINYHVSDEGQAQDILRFDFPFDLTIDQLKENAGEPDDENHSESTYGIYDTLTYKRASKRYFVADTRYQFEFKNGSLVSFKMIYTP